MDRKKISNIYFDKLQFYITYLCTATALMKREEEINKKVSEGLLEKAESICASRGVRTKLLQGLDFFELLLLKIVAINLSFSTFTFFSEFVLCG